MIAFYFPELRKADQMHGAPANVPIDETRLRQFQAKPSRSPQPSYRANERKAQFKR